MNYEKIKSGALALLVLISLAFTWGIWNYQPSYETIADGADDIVKEVEIGQQRKISELVKPSKIILHQGSDHYGTVSEQELDWMMEEMANWTFFEPENVSSSFVNELEFSKLLSSDSHVELFFSSSVPFNTIKTMFSFNDTIVPNAVFNRIVITEAEEENKAFVYFVSVQERLVFRSQIETRSLKEFKDHYVEDAARLEPYISHQVPQGSLLYVPKEPPVLTVQNYLSKQIDAETFKRALFNDPSYVRRGSRSGIDEYTDGSSFMRVNSSTGTITYVNPAETPQSMPLDQLIEKSINFVNDHKGWVDDYRLFTAEPGLSNIGYRLFSGDFPVFDSQSMAELSQIWGQDRIYQYERSSFIVQLDKPLPPEESVELKSGQEALNQVINLESIDPLLLTDMRIGYEMTLEQDSRKILTLKPFWYYQYNGVWQKLVTDERRPVDGLE
ncbi:YycH family regulatory protein [Domibacillus iocasae]|uniref:Regulatory protein YycH domain-containing protein n=1 Tax=Domibacillus iocasae TaxID=1714016 RepID=A0A1E7DT98_9BACI|nr:two-component system activity regulator YycH [Domibacillus iocasae]OES46313.1 hypothetical protein BA724_14970 [Domibacillus iocasae]